MTKIINPGGVNGTGKGVVNINSKDYKGLQKAVQEDAEKQTVEEKIRYELISLKLQIENYISNEEPDSILEVGDLLKRYLTAIRVKNKDFARFLEIEESNLSALIKGRRKINIDIAFKLGQVFDINPNLWLLIQSKNELLLLSGKKKKAYEKYQLKNLLKRVG